MSSKGILNTPQRHILKNFRSKIYFVAQLYCWLCTVEVSAQKTLIRSEKFIIEKNFFIVSAVEKDVGICVLLPKPTLQHNNLADYLFSLQYCAKLDSQLLVTYDLNKEIIDQLLDNVIRPSGNYNVYRQLPNRALWQSCWRHYFNGVNYIISGYGLTGRLRYPSIDSANYPIGSKNYQLKISGMLAEITNANAPKYFYEGPLEVALGLLRINGRDEAARFEPLDKKENRAAKMQVSRIGFSNFAFSALVIPGEGPDKYGERLSDGGKARCGLAAEWYFKKKAPFIIVSGGYCHPFKTRYCEAFEMKRYLMKVFGIPEKAIIMDPHARHTTTNFRNACRYLLNYGFPVSKAALLLTTKDQADYIADPKFELRNKRELGYLPYRELKRLSENEFSFYPVVDALFRDPLDPLDP